jgi:hypothetical protein
MKKSRLLGVAKANYINRIGLRTIFFFPSPIRPLLLLCVFAFFFLLLLSFHAIGMCPADAASSHRITHSLSLPFFFSLHFDVLIPFFGCAP